MGRDILFLAQRVPYPPDRGDRITTWHLVRHFLARGHRVRIGGFLETPGEAAAVAHLEAAGAEVFVRRLRPRLRQLQALPWLVTGRPLTVPYFVHRGLLRALRRSLLARPADTFYAYSSSMCFYMFELWAELAGARRIAHFAELDSDKWAQYAATQRFPGSWIYGREARRLLAWETRLAHATDHNVVCSPTEEALFRERIPGTPVTMMPNGVDLAAFEPGDAAAREPRTVVFTGVMSYLPNVDGVRHFVEACWPQIRRRFPDARFFIVGSSPVPEIRALDGRDGIVVTGRVPSTVPWMQRASVAVAPLRLARGIQNKVLEAMACGLPLVLSPRAFQGIDATPGEHVRLAADDAATVAHVIELLADPAGAAALGRAARRLVEARYDWDRILVQVDGLLDG